MRGLQAIIAQAEPGPRLGLIAGRAASALGPAGASEVFLRMDGDTPIFARDVSALPDPLPEALSSLGAFHDSRAVAAFLPSRDTAILGQAKALIDWHNRHGFCARCGAATAIADAGYRRDCPSCERQHFPRTDPAVIMLVVAGERCLLARNRRFANGFYWTLTGFVEPSESIEDAVRREVFEEVGIGVGQVTYFASRPWPFPSSLMIGCFAQSLSRDIQMDGAEIVTAQWVERDRVRNILGGTPDEISLPRAEAIAHHLIRAWAEGKS